MEEELAKNKLESLSRTSRHFAQQKKSETHDVSDHSDSGIGNVSKSTTSCSWSEDDGERTGVFDYFTTSDKSSTATSTTRSHLLKPELAPHDEDSDVESPGRIARDTGFASKSKQSFDNFVTDTEMATFKDYSKTRTDDYIDDDDEFNIDGDIVADTKREMNFKTQVNNSRMYDEVIECKNTDDEDDEDDDDMLNEVVVVRQDPDDNLDRVNLHNRYKDEGERFLSQSVFSASSAKSYGSFNTHYKPTFRTTEVDRSINFGVSHGTKVETSSSTRPPHGYPVNTRSLEQANLSLLNTGRKVDTPLNMPKGEPIEWVESDKKKKGKKKKRREDGIDSEERDENGNPYPIESDYRRVASYNQHSVWPRSPAQFTEYTSRDSFGKYSGDMEDSNSAVSDPTKAKTNKRKKKLEKEKEKAISAESIPGYKGNMDINDILKHIGEPVKNETVAKKKTKTKKKSGSVSHEPTEKEDNPEDCDHSAENTKTNNENNKVKEKDVSRKSSSPEPISPSVKDNKEAPKTNKKSVQNNIVDVEYIFTDIDPIPKVEQDFQPVVGKNKKKKQRLPSTSSSQVPSNTNTRDNVNNPPPFFVAAAPQPQIPKDNTYNNSKPKWDVKPRPSFNRSLTPPPAVYSTNTNVSPSTDSNICDLANFPTLESNSSGRSRTLSGRRNSTGDVPTTESLVDSDRESVHSATESSVSSWKISYAKMAAGTQSVSAAASSSGACSSAAQSESENDTSDHQSVSAIKNVGKEVGIVSAPAATVVYTITSSSVSNEVLDERTRKNSEIDTPKTITQVAATSDKVATSISSPPPSNIVKPQQKHSSVTVDSSHNKRMVPAAQPKRTKPAKQSVKQRPAVVLPGDKSGQIISIEQPISKPLGPKSTNNHKKSMNNSRPKCSVILPFEKGPSLDISFVYDENIGVPPNLPQIISLTTTNVPGNIQIPPVVNNTNVQISHQQPVIPRQPVTDNTRVQNTPQPVTQNVQNPGQQPQNGPKAVKNIPNGVVIPPPVQQPPGDVKNNVSVPNVVKVEHPKAENSVAAQGPPQSSPSQDTGATVVADDNISQRRKRRPSRNSDPNYMCGKFDLEKAVLHLHQVCETSMDYAKRYPKKVLFYES